ncbi:MAG: permease-like cell division protein FtsX [Erysipelotrichaceae bacterium]|nr:permease-like cell division protein FtsX [Erysipelotrichaceae bacterium]MDD4642415.1 permease-like cell division protein FtsX [Erysipelotrichaceae bacterium]
MITKIARILREGIYGVIRHRAMSLSSSSAVTMTLMIVSVFLILSVNIRLIVDTIESSVQIHAKIEVGTNFEQIRSVREEIENLPGVKSVTFSDKDSELNAFIEAYGDQGDLFKMYVGDKNPLRDAFLIETTSGESIENVATIVAKIDHIEKVNYGGTGTLLLMDSMESIKTGTLIVMGALGLLAILLITNTIDTTINARSDELFIMRTVGASNGFIRWPFIIEGMIIGMIGSLIPIILTVIGYIYLYNMLDGYLFTRIFALVPIVPFVPLLAAILLLLGVVVGMLGSFISVTRKLWWTR